MPETVRTLVYLLGPPGAGKTTTIAALTEAYDRTPTTIAGCPFERLTARQGETGLIPPPLRYGLPAEMWELGRTRDGGFAGTDALSMSIQPKALAALDQMTGLVLAEGDRLANHRFLQAVEEQGWQLQVAYLATPLPEAARRRHERGSRQDRAWVQSRVSKTRTLAEHFGAIPISGEGPPAELANRLADVIKYVLQATAAE